MFKLGDVFQQLVKLLSMEQNPILARSAPPVIMQVHKKTCAVLRVSPESGGLLSLSALLSVTLRHPSTQCFLGSQDWLCTRESATEFRRLVLRSVCQHGEEDPCCSATSRSAGHLLSQVTHQRRTLTPTSP